MNAHNGENIKDKFNNICDRSVDWIKDVNSM